MLAFWIPRKGVYHVNWKSGPCLLYFNISKSKMYICIHTLYVYVQFCEPLGIFETLPSSGSWEHSPVASLALFSGALAGCLVPFSRALLSHSSTPAGKLQSPVQWHTSSPPRNVSEYKLDCQIKYKWSNKMQTVMSCNLYEQGLRFKNQATS